MMEMVKWAYIDGCIPVEYVGDLNMAVPCVVAGVAYSQTAVSQSSAWVT